MSFYTHVADLKLKTRAYNALRRNGIDTIEQLQKIVEGDPSCEKLLELRALGESCRQEIKLALKKWSKANGKL